MRPAAEGPADTAAGAPSWGTFRPRPLSRGLIWLARETPFGRGAGRKAIFRTLMRLDPGPVDVTLWGTHVRLHPARNVSERKALLRPDHMDAAEHAALREAMARPGAVFVDVGGNAGLYSLDAALHAGAGSRIMMIEPDPGLIGRFAFNLAQARAAGLVDADVRVETIAVAISDQDGEGVLTAAGDEGSRHLAAGPAVTGKPVRLRTLAGLVRERGLTHIDVMKIDVEGHEDKVLPPYFASVDATLRPRLVIIEHLERRNWKPDCIADALARGYALQLTTRNNTVLARV